MKCRRLPAALECMRRPRPAAATQPTLPSLELHNSVKRSRYVFIRRKLPYVSSSLSQRQWLPHIWAEILSEVAFFEISKISQDIYSTFSWRSWHKYLLKSAYNFNLNQIATSENFSPIVPCMRAKYLPPTRILIDLDTFQTFIFQLKSVKLRFVYQIIKNSVDRGW